MCILFVFRSVFFIYFACFVADDDDDDVEDDEKIMQIAKLRNTMVVGLHSIWKLLNNVSFSVSFRVNTLVSTQEQYVFVSRYIR